MSEAITAGCSGGRTSAYLTHILKVIHENVTPILCDTGAEHPKTYKFVMQCVEHFDWDLVCLQAKVNHGTRKTNDYMMVPYSALKWDLKTIKAITNKYGGFTDNRPHCTDKMKSIISDKYRKEHHPNAIHYLGIRRDEPSRLVGRKLFLKMRKANWEPDDITDAFLTVRRGNSYLGEFHQELRDRDSLLKNKRLAFMAEVSDFEKPDVLNWWSQQPFDLEIPEHLGNCVFCIKKSQLKVVLAMRDEPHLLEEWKKAVAGDHVRLMPADKHGIGKIYKGWSSVDDLLASYKDVSTDHLRDRIYKGRLVDTGACSESCEPNSEVWE